MYNNENEYSGTSFEYNNGFAPGNNGFAFAALILGVSALFSLFTVYLPLILGSLAILFALLSKGYGKKMAATAKIGFISAITGLSLILSILAVGITSLYLLFATSTDDQLMNGISLYPNSGYNYTSPYAAVSTAAGNTASGNSSLTGVEESKPVVNPGESTKVSPGRKSSPAECQTCKERKYQDGSDEMVSFKSAAHISPEASASTVRAHEQEHVSNAYRKAAKGGGKVISANVSLQRAICPECGRSYVSGGTTSTKISYPNEQTNPYARNQKSADAAMLIGSNLDLAV